MIRLRSYRSSCGELLLGDFQGRLCLCDWRYRRRREAVDRRLQRYLKADFETGDSELLQLTIDQLEQYFAGERQVFTVPLRFAGSEFQQRVWQALVEVPYGERVSYLELAKRVGDAKAVRAVAAANGANALSILVPCHRVVASDGALTGYAGGLKAKQYLLQLEQPIRQESLF
ncbi:methylated-DNA--[protein]-cysteine S-methyltransferase [Motiliproteus sp.]|uniref:methylated-DNA--[protein]-cysteine S-methyltransferase n=1 Tax=Motiliproteus sp. TaxID=1898955 RepID=UPI003BAC3F78